MCHDGFANPYTPSKNIQIWLFLNVTSTVAAQNPRSALPRTRRVTKIRRVNDVGDRGVR